jgi:hypothetical protein
MDVYAIYLGIEQDSVQFHLLDDKRFPGRPDGDANP